MVAYPGISWHIVTTKSSKKSSKTEKLFNFTTRHFLQYIIDFIVFHYVFLLVVAVLIPCTSSAYGKQLPPVGKSYASIVDDEKSAFEQGRKHRQNGHKNPATSIVAAFADKGG